MPIPDNYDELIKQLELRTLENLIEWKRESNAQFYTSLKRHSIVIWEYSSPHEDDEGISFALRDSSGTITDLFSISDGSSGYVRLKNLFDLARRKANNVDEVVKEICQELKGDL